MKTTTCYITLSVLVALVLALGLQSQAASVTGQVWTGAAAIVPAVESAHPYSPNISQTYTFNAPTGTMTRLHFETLDTEPGYDWVTIQDGAGNTYARYAGWKLADIWTPWVPGSIVKIIFVSDYSAQGNGWVIDRYATDETASPIAGATIALTPGGVTATTGADGTYTISGIPAGNYTAAASLAGMAFSPVSIGVSPTDSQGAVADFEAYENAVTSVVVSPNPFTPNGSDRTVISVGTSSPQAGMYAKVIGGSINHQISLTETVPGSYTGSWDGIDRAGAEPRIPASNTFAVKIYNGATDQFPLTSSVALNSVSSVSASPTIFYPTTGQNASITVAGGAGLPLELRVLNSGGTVVRMLPLAWNATAYTATWDGRDGLGNYQPAGDYSLVVYRADTVMRYAVSGTVAIGLAAGITGQVWTGAVAVDPKLESAHPYNPGLDETYTFTAPSGTKTRLHIESMDTEPGYDWLTIQDEAGNTYTRYAGRNLSDFWTPWVPGRTIKLQFHSDGSAQGAGWVVDRYATDETASPVWEATITLSPGGRTATTGENGIYSIADLNPGTYTVNPSLAGYAFSSRSTGVTVSATQGGIVDFEAYEDYISSVSALPNPFAPTGVNTTIITASGQAGETGLYARVTGSGIDSRVELTESSAGNYTGEWDGLDISGIEPRIPISGTYNVKVYNLSNDQFSKGTSVTLNSITGVAASPTTFYPTAGQSTIITVSGSSGLALEARLIKSDGTTVRTLPLTWSASVYTATWDGKNGSGEFQSAGNYDIRIYRSDTGFLYTTTGTVAIGQAAGVTGQVWTGAAAVDPKLESAHPYNPNLDETYTFTAPSGTKTRLHIESMDTEANYDWLTFQDEAGNTIIRYAGRNLNDFWTPWIPGRTVKILFHSDYAAQGAGWVIDRYTTDDIVSPVWGATIALSPGGRTATTGENGMYSIADLNPDTYAVTPSLMGWEFSSRSTSVTVSSTQGGIIDFEAYEKLITAVSASPNPFVPDGINITTITASGVPGKTGLYARVAGSGIDQRIELTESSAGNYTGEWDGVDISGIEPRIAAPGSYTVRVYNQYTDVFSATATITLQGTIAVSTTPATFYPTSGQSTSIKVTGSINSLPLEARIANSEGVVVRTLPLSWSSDAYYATWDGKDGSGIYSPVGSYEVRVHRSDTGTRYTASGTVAIGAAATATGLVWTGATAMTPVIESAHPYNPGLDETYMFTAPSGTKTRLHIESMDTEAGFDWLTVQDEAGNTYIRYAGRNLNDFWTPWVPGRTIKILFHSDGSAQGAGWVIDRYATDDTTVGVDGVTITASPTTRTANSGIDGIYNLPDLAPESYAFVPSKTGWRFSQASTSALLTAGQTTVMDFEAWENWVISANASPNPFVPSGANAATITVTGRSGETDLYTRIQGPASDQKLALGETESGIYTSMWDGMDHSFADPRILPAGTYSARPHNEHADPFSSSTNITLSSVGAVSANPASFYGTAGQTTAITVSAASGLPIEVRIANASGTVVRSLPLTWNSSSYVATWDGKSGNGTVQAPGNYELRVYRTDTGTRYVTTGSAVVLPAAGVRGQVWIGGQALLPVVESAHPYANSYSHTWTITSTGGTRTRIHFERVDTQSPDDHLYVKDVDDSVIADYRGTYTDIWSPWVTGNTVKLQLVSNASVNGYGFLADKDITDASATGVEGVTIAINPGNRKTVTGPGGSYSVMDLVPGSYTVVPSGSGWAFDPASAGVSLATGSVTTVDFWAIQEGEVLKSIAQARQRPDGWSVQLPYSVVSAVYANYFYIEDADRAAGIRVEGTAPVMEGNLARVVGRLTTINGERVILPYSVETQSAEIMVRPLGIINKSAVGSDLNAYTNGAYGSVGTNNSGLLMRVFGRVTSVSSNAFYIDDGSGLNNGLGIAVSTSGLYTGRSLPAVAVNDWVAVTGVAATVQNGNLLDPVIRPRDHGDVQIGQ